MSGGTTMFTKKFMRDLSGADEIADLQEQVTALQEENKTLRTQSAELVVAAERLLPYLPDEANLLDNASVSDGRASEYDMAAVGLRKTVAKIKTG